MELFSIRIQRTFQLVSTSILLPNRALLINPADGSDPLFLYFRFYYSKDSEKVYLELSKDNSFTEYTRYEFVTTL